MFKDHFSERAASYALCRPGYPPELAAWLASVAPARTRAWDAGCGSGQLSVQLAEWFDEVVATDASAAQIAHARAQSRVRYLVATAEASGLPRDSVDLSASAQAAHWFDLPRYWEEVRRVGRARSIVALVTYVGPEVAPAVDELVDRFYHDDVGRYWTPERRLVESGYRTIDFPFAELPAPPFASSERWTADQFIGYVGTWSAVQGLKRDGGGARLDAFAGNLREAWGGQAREVTWPLALRVGRVSG